MIMASSIKLIAATTLMASGFIVVVSGDVFSETLGSAVIAEMRKTMKLQQNWDRTGNSMRYYCSIPSTNWPVVFKSVYRLSGEGYTTSASGPSATLADAQRACSSNSLKYEASSSHMSEQDCKAHVAATLSNERLCGRNAKGSLETLEEVKALFAPESYRSLADAVKSKAQAKLGLIQWKGGIIDCPRGTRFCFRCKNQKFSLLHCTTVDNNNECNALSKKPVAERPAGTLALDDFGEICAKSTLFETPAECLAYLKMALSPSDDSCDEKEIDSFAAWVAPIKPGPISTIT